MAVSERGADPDRKDRRGSKYVRIADTGGESISPFDDDGRYGQDRKVEEQSAGSGSFYLSETFYEGRTSCVDAE